MMVTPDSLMASLSSLQQSTSPKFAVDTETTGLREHDRPFSAIIADHENSFYFDNRVLSNAQVQGALDTVLCTNKSIIMQNAKFDMRMIGQQWPRPCPWPTVEDTEVLGRLVRNDHLTYGLDAQTKRYGLFKDDIAKKYIAEHKLFTNVVSEFGTKTKLLHYDRLPLEIVAPYGAQDGRATYDLHTALMMDLDPKSLGVWETEKKLTKVCYGMERAGIQLDIQYTRDAMAYEEGLIREAKSQFLLATGQIYDNKKSSLVEIFTKAGETIPKTAKGNDQLNDDVLESLTSPAAKIVQRIRFYEKRISTYYTSFLELADPEGIIRADMRQAGTTTGRFSYREPNLQNVPKEEDSTDPFVVRGCFKPRPGKILVSLDYKQQEYRLMLAYAKHTRLIREVMAGADVHQAVADLLGISRKLAKTLNFAILYGAGPAKIAWMLGISVVEAKRLRDRYFNGLLEVEKLIFDVTKVGSARGHIFNWAGRKLHINDKKFAYALPNHLIQSGGADICKAAMVNIAEDYAKGNNMMLVQIHDALVFEMEPQELSIHAPRLKQIMIDSFPPKNGMYMDVDVTWSAKSLAERDMQKWAS